MVQTTANMASETAGVGHGEGGHVPNEREHGFGDGGVGHGEGGHRPNEREHGFEEGGHGFEDVGHGRNEREHGFREGEHGPGESGHGTFFQAPVDFGITGHAANEVRAMTMTTPRDRRSFERALREGIPAVLDVMRLRGVPENDREDAAQKALTRAFEHIDAYDPTRPFLPWLKTIAHRTATDHLRALRSRRKREDVTADGVPESIDQRAPNEEQMIRRHDAPKLLEEVLAALSDERREVFVMAEVDDLSTEEIAANLQTNANTVRSRLSRAREDFEAALKRRWIAEESRSGATVPLPAFLFSASALIDAGRSSSSAPDVLARVWSEVARAIGSSLPAPARPDAGGQTGGASPSAPQAPASPLSTLRDAGRSSLPAWLGGGASLKATLIASAAVFGAVVGGGLLWVRATHSPPSSPPIHRDEATASATPVAAPTDTPTTTISAAPSPTTSSSPTATASAAPSRVDPAVLERQEAALLDKAHGLFSAAKVKEGCDVLRTMAQRFPRGVYREQRAVLWNAAKCGEVKPP